MYIRAIYIVKCVLETNGVGRHVQAWTSLHAQVDCDARHWAGFGGASKDTYKPAGANGIGTLYGRALRCTGALCVGVGFACAFMAALWSNTVKYIYIRKYVFVQVHSDKLSESLR